MRILYLGDVMGRSGREAVTDRLPALRRDLAADFVAVNAENAAGGFGLTRAIAEEMFGAGADCLLSGNHAFDQPKDLDLYDDEPRLLRPINFPDTNPGRGASMIPTPGGHMVMVIQMQGQVFMGPTGDPVPPLEAALEPVRLGRDCDAIVVDVHAEATSEKYSVGHMLDGRVSLVAGTHTHVPTADAQVLPGGTAFQCDVGMCGDYDSVIGMDKARIVERYATRMRGERPQPAGGEATLCGVFVVTDDRTGLALSCEPVRVGGRLAPALPRGAVPESQQA